MSSQPTLKVSCSAVPGFTLHVTAAEAVDGSTVSATIDQQHQKDESGQALLPWTHNTVQSVLAKCHNIPLVMHFLLKDVLLGNMTESSAALPVDATTTVPNIETDAALHMDDCDDPLQLQDDTDAMMLDAADFEL